MLQVNPLDLSNDADPKFITEFYKNLKILSQDLYKKSAVAQTNFASSGANRNKDGGIFAGNASVNNSLQTSAGKRNRGGLSRSSLGAGAEELTQSASLASLALGDDLAVPPPLSSPKPTTESAFQQHPADYFSTESLQDRLKMYAQQGGIPMEYVDRYSARNNTNSST